MSNIKIQEYLKAINLRSLNREQLIQSFKCLYSMYEIVEQSIENAKQSQNIKEEDIIKKIKIENPQNFLEEQKNTIDQQNNYELSDENVVGQQITVRNNFVVTTQTGGKFYKCACHKNRYFQSPQAFGGHMKQMKKNIKIQSRIYI